MVAKYNQLKWLHQWCYLSALLKVLTEQDKAICSVWYRGSDPQLGLFGASGWCFTKMSSIQPDVELGNQCNPLTAYSTFSRAVFCKNSFTPILIITYKTIPPYVLFPTIIAGFGHLPKSITNNKNNEKYKSNYKEWPSISIIGCINGLTIAPSRSSIACPQTPALISPIAIKAVKKA